MDDDLALVEGPQSESSSLVGAALGRTPKATTPQLWKTGIPLGEQRLLAQVEEVTSACCASAGLSAVSDSKRSYLL